MINFKHIFSMVAFMGICCGLTGCVSLCADQNKLSTNYKTSKVLITDLTKPASARTYLLEDGQMCNSVGD